MEHFPLFKKFGEGGKTLKQFNTRISQNYCVMYWRQKPTYLTFDAHLKL